MDLYRWSEALHIIFVITWMSGMLYLPRLFVYHAQVEPGSDVCNILKVMEKRLLRYIVNPSFFCVLALGVFLLFITDDLRNGMMWIHVKLVLVLGLVVCHGMMAKYRKDFELERNKKSHVFYRYFNEVPAILMICIVLLAVLKPF